MRPVILLALVTVAAAQPKSDHQPPVHPAAAPAAAERPHPPALLAAVPPGVPAEKIRRLLLKPYAAATGVDFPTLVWDGSSDGLKALLTSHGADLVLIDAATLADLCRSQALMKLDWTALDRNRLLPGAASDCGAGAFETAITLAWDRSKLPGATPGWSDFWDVARHPGRRGLQNRARGTLEIALLADGISPGDVYRTLRTPDGVDRAFRKLDQLKPYIVWWDQPAQTADFLGSGKALLTSAPIDSIVAAARPNLGTSATGNLTGWCSFAVPQGAPHPAAATLALIIAADPARQADFAHATGLGPATALALDLLPADVRAQIPRSRRIRASRLPSTKAFGRRTGINSRLGLRPGSRSK